MPNRERFAGRIGTPSQIHEHRLERLIDRLPGRAQAATRWLRQPSSRWARIPAGMLLVGGGVLSILPLLGLWMLPLGLMLLAEDLPGLRRMRGHLLDWMADRRPHWFTEAEIGVDRRPSSLDLIDRR